MLRINLMEAWCKAAAEILLKSLSKGRGLYRTSWEALTQLVPLSRYRLKSHKVSPHRCTMKSLKRKRRRRSHCQSCKCWKRKYAAMLSWQPRMIMTMLVPQHIRCCQKLLQSPMTPRRVTSSKRFVASVIEKTHTWRSQCSARNPLTTKSST